MNELFPEDQVKIDSPMLKWCKQHMVRLHYWPEALGDGQLPYIAWLPDNDDRYVEGIPYNMDKCGEGETREEALQDLGTRMNIKLWNEV